jgi:cysteine desulfurase/selenocysteine lyase
MRNRTASANIPVDRFERNCAGQLHDVQALDVDYPSFSFARCWRPSAWVRWSQGASAGGVLALPTGRHGCRGEGVQAAWAGNALPWKYAAGTPNILAPRFGASAAPVARSGFAPGASLLLDSDRSTSAGTSVRYAAGVDMVPTTDCERLERLGAIEGTTIHGPREAARRSALVASTWPARSVDLARLQRRRDRGARVAIARRSRIGRSAFAPVAACFYLQHLTKSTA